MHAPLFVEVLPIFLGRRRSNPVGIVDVPDLVDKGKLTFGYLRLWLERTLRSVHRQVPLASEKPTGRFLLELSDSRLVSLGTEACAINRACWYLGGRRGSLSSLKELRESSILAQIEATFAFIVVLAPARVRF